MNAVVFDLSLSVATVAIDNNECDAHLHRLAAAHLFSLHLAPISSPHSLY